VRVKEGCEVPRASDHKIYVKVCLLDEDFNVDVLKTLTPEKKQQALEILLEDCDVDTKRLLIKKLQKEQKQQDFVFSNLKVAYDNSNPLLLPEIILLVFTFMDGNEVANSAARVCKLWNFVSQTDNFWKTQFNKEWRLKMDGDLSIVKFSYKNLYIKSWKQEKAIKKAHKNLPNEPLLAKAIREGSLPYRDGTFINHENGATPIYYKFNNEKNHWMWSPDHFNWMPVSENVVQGGIWRGQQPVLGNVNLIKWLNEHRPIPHYISNHIWVEKRNLTLSDCFENAANFLKKQNLERHPSVILYHRIFAEPIYLSLEPDGWNAKETQAFTLVSIPNLRRNWL